jgi:hypothetical protein
MIAPTPDGFAFLAIAYALMLFAVCMERISVWLILLFIGYELEWFKAIPFAWHELSSIDKWWLVACNLTMAFIADELGLLRRAWMDRDLKRVMPGSESRECTSQELIETSRRISPRG